MTARHFVYGRLTQFTPLTDLIGEDNPRVFAKKTMTSSIEQHPYVVYKLGNESSELLAEDNNASRQFFQVWIHDYHDGDVADYDKIDEVATQVKKAFQNVTGEGEVYFATYLETSQDLNDDTLNTVFRYLRFQLIKSEEK